MAVRDAKRRTQATQRMRRVRAQAKAKTSMPRFFATSIAMAIIREAAHDPQVADVLIADTRRHLSDREAKRRKRAGPRIADDAVDCTDDGRELRRANRGHAQHDIIDP